MASTRDKHFVTYFTDQLRGREKEKGIKTKKASEASGQDVMKQTWHGHSAFRIEAGAAKILIDPFLSDNPSWDKGWSGYLAGKNSTQGGDR